MDDSTIDQVERLRSDDTGISFLGLKQTPDGHFEKYLEAQAAAPLEEPRLIGLRQKFTPESMIAEPPARAPLLQRKASGALPAAFLDLDQESLAKLDLELPPDAERALHTSDTRLLTGPAGSGKSLVLLHRALIAARLHPRARLLILTHNKPINAELERRALKTAPDGRRIQWLTFFKWAVRSNPTRFNKIVGSYEIVPRLARLMEKRGPIGALTPQFISEEIDYLRDLGIGSLEDYLALERKGRLTGLSRDRKEAIWRLLEAYRADLASRGESDWHEIALGFRDLAIERPYRLTKHDFIFIDEAQFFAKIWFQPVLASLAPGGQLFLAADPTQGFLKRRESWLAAGIDVRGRSSRLAKPYRSTRAILNFAIRLLDARSPLHPAVSPDDLDPPSAGEVAATDAGEPPILLQAASPQDATARAVTEVEKLLRERPQLAGSVLLLHADSLAAHGLAESLGRRLGRERVANLNSRDTPPADPLCKVSNLNAATGLEAAVVFLLGLGTLLEKEADPRLDADSRAELAASHTRLLYMACTRAGSRLVIVDPSPLMAELAGSARIA